MAVKAFVFVVAAVLAGVALMSALPSAAAASADPEIIAKVVNISGQPVANATVIIKNVSSGNSGSYKTGSNGTVAQSVSPGTYDITALLSGYTANWTYFNESILTTDFYANFTMYELQGNLTGYVNNGFVSLPMATVVLNNSTVAFTTHTSEPLGEYSFSNIPGGDFNVTVSKAGYFTNSTTIRIVQGVHSWLNFTLRPLLGELVGVVNATNSLGRIIPLGGANVTLISSNGSLRHTVTDSSGLYEFVNVSQGNYIVRVEKGGFSPGESSVTIQLSRIVSLNFTLVALSHSYIFPVSGFIGKLDLNHSLMFIALALSIIIVAGSVTLLNKSYNWKESPESKKGKNEDADTGTGTKKS
ncbi:MAG: carboxypeptidase-like regulatory domain-containing protein [Candidatus Thermoplasmatota archaeon]|jgi:hypothetical protein|nr:carboxypeptidase-like regulatory domain-containing protein [Candidatus Thermoplasmatota archaeon]